LNAGADEVCLLPGARGRKAVQKAFSSDQAEGASPTAGRKELKNEGSGGVSKSKEPPKKPQEHSPSHGWEIMKETVLSFKNGSLRPNPLDSGTSWGDSGPKIKHRCSEAHR